MVLGEVGRTDDPVRTDSVSHSTGRFTGMPHQLPSSVCGCCFDPSFVHLPVQFCHDCVCDRPPMSTCQSPLLVTAKFGSSRTVSFFQRGKPRANFALRHGL
ncbi:hypothetical protein KC19_12G011200 [Ceratodon purpureus]|uniref:Uncharacterized protein n=1 Tax=Ceratodon purpureus TaxID=3225 RepID=A0A8T0G2F1_CERPU|nr:hypothetical protein KC19_12G011200 [Ceratodon purpureus]